MPSTLSLRTSILVLVLGSTMLWIAVDAGGPETDVVRQYTAYEVDYDEELVLTNEETESERTGARISSANVDDRIVCLPAATRECSFAHQEFEGDVDAEGLVGQYRYAYFDDEFYRIAEEEAFNYTYERTDADEVFARLAVDSDRLTDAEREVVESGQRVSDRPYATTTRLVAHEGSYYTILQTGQKAYSDGGAFCSSSGDDFCGEADSHRRNQYAKAVGLGLLGLLGVGVGGRGVLRNWYSRRD